MPIVLGCLAFLSLFVLTRQLQPEGILFYQGLACALACAIGQAMCGLRWSRVGRVAVAKDALLTLLLAYAFMFTVPTTVDRAYSVRLIQQLASRPEGMNRAEMEAWFSQRFIALGGVERRVQEQLASGTLHEAPGGRLTLTGRGHSLARSFDFFQWLFNCAGPA